MPAGFICLPAAAPFSWTIHLHERASSSSSFCSPLPRSFLTSPTFTHWSLCHFLNNDPGAGGTTACLYFITVRPLCRRPASVDGGGESDRVTERERGGLEESGGWGVVAHGDGGGRGTLVTDRSADVAIRA